MSLGVKVRSGSLEVCPKGTTRPIRFGSHDPPTKANFLKRTIQIEPAVGRSRRCRLSTTASGRIRSVAERREWVDSSRSRNVAARRERTAQAAPTGAPESRQLRPNLSDPAFRT